MWNPKSLGCQSGQSRRDFKTPHAFSASWGQRSPLRREDAAVRGMPRSRSLERVGPREIAVVGIDVRLFGVETLQQLLERSVVPRACTTAC